MEPTILTKLLESFIEVFVAGQARLLPEALLLLKALVTIELVLLGIHFSLSQQFDWPALVWKMIGVGVLIGIMTLWPTLTKGIFRVFMRAGIQAGGDAISETDMTDPGNIALYGLSVTAVVFQHLKEYAGPSAVLNLPEILFSGFAALAVVLAYFALAIWDFIVILEFYAFTAFGIFLVPFAVNRHLAFLAEKTIGAICASAVQMLALSFVTSAALPIMVRLQAGLNPTLQHVLVLLLGALALDALAWRAYKIANTVIHGTPQLTIQDAVRVVQTITQRVQQIGNVVHSVSHPQTPPTRRRS